jgi:hypothetical protein
MSDHLDSYKCRKLAAEYRERARDTLDPVRKSEFEVLERKWLIFAARFEAQERRGSGSGSHRELNSRVLSSPLFSQLAL